MTKKQRALEIIASIRAFLRLFAPGQQSFGDDHIFGGRDLQVRTLAFAQEYGMYNEKHNLFERLEGVSEYTKGYLDPGGGNAAGFC